MKIFGYIFLGIILMIVSSYFAEVIRVQTGFRLIYTLNALFWIFLWWRIVVCIKKSCTTQKHQEEVMLKAEVEKTSIEDAARVTALDELESGKLNRLAWAKALEESDGNEARAKSLYIKFRVEQVLKQKQQERKEQECREQERRAEEAAKRRAEDPWNNG
mgnify:CR=1 FL=1